MRSELQKLAKRFPPENELFSFVLDLIRDDGTPASSPDLNCAVVGGAAVEHALKLAISKHLTPSLSGDELEAVFGGDNPNGVIATFDDRINMAFALGVVTKDARDELRQIKLIRNSFAYAIMPMSFEDDGVRAAVDLISRAGRKPKGVISLDKLAPLLRFAVICALYADDFATYVPPSNRGLFGAPRAGNIFANALRDKPLPEGDVDL